MDLILLKSEGHRKNWSQRKRSVKVQSWVTLRRFDRIRKGKATWNSLDRLTCYLSLKKVTRKLLRVQSSWPRLANWELQRKHCDWQCGRMKDTLQEWGKGSKLTVINTAEQKGWKKKPWKSLICDLSVLTCTHLWLEPWRGGNRSCMTSVQGSGLGPWPVLSGPKTSPSSPVPSHPEEKLPWLPAVIKWWGGDHRNKKGSHGSTNVTLRQFTYHLICQRSVTNIYQLCLILLYHYKTMHNILLNSSKDCSSRLWAAAVIQNTTIIWPEESKH